MIMAINMTYPYNITQLQAADTVSKFVIFPNSVVGESLVGLFILAIGFVFVYKYSDQWELDSCILAASFGCFVISTVATYAKLTNFLFPLAFLIIMAFTLMVAVMKRK